MGKKFRSILREDGTFLHVPVRGPVLPEPAFPVLLPEPEPVVEPEPVKPVRKPRAPRKKVVKDVPVVDVDAP